MGISRAYTPEEIKEKFLAQVRAIAEYWASLPYKTDLERCNGVVFSVLNIIDGKTELPAIKMSISPHPDDKEFCLNNEEDFYEDGTIFNDCYLHEQYYEIVSRLDHVEAYTPSCRDYFLAAALQGILASSYAVAISKTDPEDIEQIYESCVAGASAIVDKIFERENHDSTR